MLRALGMATAAAIVLSAPGAASAGESCQLLEVDLTPSDDLQIVVWLEDGAGQFVDTLYITDGTGRYGLGNRPGIMEFNSEFLWPYGRRESMFPVWAHKHGVTYPKLVFQDGADRDLSHAFSKSSGESHFCRPLRSDEPVRDRSIDTGTCATTAFTDKGKFSTLAGPAGRSLYPPRRDVTFLPGTDHPDVEMFATLNDLDAVSRATPAGNTPFNLAAAIPASLPDGDYTVWIEVNKENDTNIHYRYPSPQLQAYGDYGEPYRGQPSIVWKVPIVLDQNARESKVNGYSGYGDPDGVDGLLRTPDATITADQEGSGAGRLLLRTTGGNHRVAVKTTPAASSQPPGAPSTMNVVTVDYNLARISFIEPSDPQSGGAVKAYEVRLGLGEKLTPENIATAGRVLPVKVTPSAPGSLQTVEIPDLLPETHYWIGIRAQDDCLNSGEPAIVELVTPRFVSREVAACFVATAAYGSPMMAEVGMLRRFRDKILRRVVVGELFVETYYTFGPALAGVIAPSPTLRQAARAGLGPLVDLARRLDP